MSSYHTNYSKLEAYDGWSIYDNLILKSKEFMA